MHTALTSSVPVPELVPGLQRLCCAQDSVLCVLPISLITFSVLLICLDFFPFLFSYCEQELPQLYSEMLCIYSITEWI